MWYKKTLVVFLVFSCKPIPNLYDWQDFNLSTSLATPKYQTEYSILKEELDRMFFTHVNYKKKCDISLFINKTSVGSGITSTTFAVNETLISTVTYTLKCNDNTKIVKTISMSSDFNITQAKTVGQYVSERTVAREIAKKIATKIYEDIKLSSLLLNQK